jgi:hypothetical protein
MKNKTLKMSLTAAMLVGMMSITGCSNPKEPMEAPVGAVKGSVVDGYINGATVCVDVNDNSVCESNEPRTITDINGKYNLDISSLTDAQRETVKIIVSGGIDAATGKSFTGIMKSSLIPDLEEININALTTIAALKTVKNVEALAKLKEVAETVGITVDELKSDILKLNSRKAFEQALKLQKAVENLGLALGNNAREDSEKIMKELSKKFNGNMKDIEDILDETTFTAELAELENIKVNVKNIVNVISFNDSDTMEALEQAQIRAEARREALKEEIEKVKLLGRTLDKLDNTSLMAKYNNIESIYTDANRESIKFLNELKIEESLIRNVNFISMVKALNLTDDMTVDQMLVIINNAESLSEEYKLILVKSLTFKTSFGEVDTDNEEQEEIAMKLITLGLKDLALDPKVLTELEKVDFGSNDYAQVIATLQITAMQKSALIASLVTYYSVKQAEYLKIATELFGVVYSTSELSTVLATLELDLDSDNLIKELKEKVSESVLITEEIKTNMLNIIDGYIAQL